MNKEQAGALEQQKREIEEKLEKYNKSKEHTSALNRAMVKFHNLIALDGRSHLKRFSINFRNDAALVVEVNDELVEIPYEAFLGEKEFAVLSEVKPKITEFFANLFCEYLKTSQQELEKL